ncbi:MAG: VCBS domain-containing protein, partial [Thermodesulfobacteriota bacterium]|nr:VCBS domain-containing protein [Thermodesulfobacteriota bacterium]
MPADNNKPGTSPSNPINNQTDTSEQDWLDLGQQDVAGETLKAKKWTTQRRVVDDGSHHGNIHTGTEQQKDLNKSNKLTEDPSKYRPLHIETPDVQGNKSTEQQPGISQKVSSETDIQKDAETSLAKPGDYGNGTDAESVATSGGSDTLTFEERVDDSNSTKHSSKKSKSTATVAQPAVTEVPPEAISEEVSPPVTDTTTREDTSSMPPPAVNFSETVIEKSVLPPTPAPDSNPMPDSDPETDPEPEAIVESTTVAPTTITGIGGTVTEDSVTSISGQLSISDPDAGEDHFNADIAPGTYGTLELNENGLWTYTLNNDAENVQQLGEGQTTEDVITITSVDGTEHQLSFTVTG